MHVRVLKIDSFCSIAQYRRWSWLPWRLLPARWGGCSFTRPEDAMEVLRRFRDYHEKEDRAVWSLDADSIWHQIK